MTTAFGAFISVSGTAVTREHTVSVHDSELIGYAGSPCPPQRDGAVRLYSMRFCPFSQRVRLVLCHKQIDFQVVNIDLTNKPVWFSGDVPRLQQEGRFITDSSIICEYLDDAYCDYPGNKLLSTDPYLKAKQKMLMEASSKIVVPFNTFLHGKPEEMAGARKALQAGLDHFEGQLSDKYFAGLEVGMVDYHIWPWIERLPILKDLHSFNPLPSDRYPKLTSWVKVMQETPGVKETRMDLYSHLKFIQGLLNNTPQFDFGLF